MRMQLQEVESFWAREDSLEAIWDHLEGELEEAKFFSGLKERVGYYSHGERWLGECWSEAQALVQNFLTQWKPNPHVTIDCWKTEFERWRWEDRTAANMIALVDRGIEFGYSSTRGIKDLIEDYQLIYHCLRAMAAGIRPGPNASECRSIIRAGSFFFASGEKPAYQKNLWKAAVLHNQQFVAVSCFNTIREIDYSKAIKVMLEAKREQIGTKGLTWPAMTIRDVAIQFVSGNPKDLPVDLITLLELEEINRQIELRKKLGRRDTTLIVDKK